MCLPNNGKPKENYMLDHIMQSPGCAATDLARLLGHHRRLADVLGAIEAGEVPEIDVGDLTLVDLAIIAFDAAGEAVLAAPAETDEDVAAKLEFAMRWMRSIWVD